MHGLGLNSESFEPQLDELSDEFNVVAWNMPNLGSTSSKAMNFDNLANSGFQLLDSLDIKSCHVVGHSMGGMIALEMALINPDRIKSISLLGATSAFGGKDDTFKNSFLSSRLRPLSEGHTMKEVAQYNVPLMFSEDANQEYITRSIEAMGKISTNEYRLALECLTTFNRRTEISFIEQPCCLIAASLDQAAPASTMKKMSEKIKNSSYHLIDNCGHMMQLDKPEKINTIIRAFLKGLT